MRSRSTTGRRASSRAACPLTDFGESHGGLTRWDEWCAAWSARAEVHEASAGRHWRTASKLSAGEHLTRAAICYHFGKFMFVHDLEQMKRAHRKVIECRELALLLLAYAGARVMIPYGGGHLAGTLRNRRASARPPVVVMCVGLDSTKEQIDGYENIFARARHGDAPV